MAVLFVYSELRNFDKDYSLSENQIEWFIYVIVCFLVFFLNLYMLTYFYVMAMFYLHILAKPYKVSTCMAKFVIWFIIALIVIALIRCYLYFQILTSICMFENIDLDKNGYVKWAE